MRVVVCAIAKNEHLYINEWVKHYIELGVDHIYLYDNDDKTSRFVGCYINQKYANKITIYNVRGIKMPFLQHKVYNAFYHKHRFDYCLYCDIDEFLVGIDNIKTYLSNINAKQIRIKWKLFGDDDVIERDMKIPVKDFFKKEITESLTNDLKRKNTLERQGKFIVKGGLYGIWVNSCHYASKYMTDEPIQSILPSGKPCKSRVAIDEDYSSETIFLNHYITKTLSEFIKQKLNRNDAVFNKSLKMNYFWRVNKKTPEKIAYLKNLGLE